jgi:hypothetical protein
MPKRLQLSQLSFSEISNLTFEISEPFPVPAVSPECHAYSRISIPDWRNPAVLQYNPIP